MFSGCIKDDERLRITFTDIPAEYNGKTSQASLCDEDYYVVGSGASLEIVDGKATIYFSYSAYYNYLTIRDKGKYNLVFHIKEGFHGIYPWDKEYDPENLVEEYVVWHWEGERQININKTHTTVSFNSLKKWEDVSYPYTEYFTHPDLITITDIPAEYNSIHDYYNRRDGYVYLLKPDDRELYAYSGIFNPIEDGKTVSNMDRINSRNDLERGKYIVAFKIKWRRGWGSGELEWDETVYWEGESEPMDITQVNTTISFNSFKQWNRSYPYETEEKDKTRIGWKDRD